MIVFYIQEFIPAQHVIHYYWNNQTEYFGDTYDFSVIQIQVYFT